MKVLQICLKPPYPEVDGGCKAMNAFAQGLIENNVDIKLLTISTTKHPFLKRLIPAEYLEKTKIEHVFVDTKVKAIKALGNLTSSKSYNIERFYDKKFERLVVQTLQKEDFEVILLESLYVSKYVKAIRKYTNAKIVLRAHNVESLLWQRNASKQKGIKKVYVKTLANKLGKYEKESLNSFDGIAAITEKDKKTLQQMGCTIPIEVFPFGINMSDYRVGKQNVGKKVFHIGSMDWAPNSNGIKWFLNNVWETVVEAVPTAQLNLAGRKMPLSIKQHQAKNLKVLGKVKSAIDFITENHIMVVPLLTGGGMRVKIIEGMALSKIIIATSIAAEGINYTNKKNIIIVDTPTAMANAIIDCLNNEEKQLAIGTQAKKLVEKDYNNKIIVANLLTFFKQIKP